MNNVLYSHLSDDWSTPSFIMDFVKKHDYIDVFPYKCNYNELDRSYKGKKLYINPPFSLLNNYCDWICQQIENNRVVILLIPSRTDTRYFDRFIKYKPLIYFVKGRLKFNDSKKSAPFPTILMVFYKRSFVPLYTSISQDDIERCFI